LIVVGANNNVYLIVYEMPMQSMGDPGGGCLEKFQIDSFSDSYSALNEARELEKKLKCSDNPVLVGCGSDDLSFVAIYYEKDYDSSDYPMTFPSGLVKRTELSSDARSNPDKYVKPLDIVLAVSRSMVHACVYLGDKKVCHVLGG
jgi:hypothetical protein